MNQRMEIIDALPRCFPLPRWIELGDQQWILSHSTLRRTAPDTITIALLLSGPYQRQRRVRLEVGVERLLAGDYDPQRAVSLILIWLPNSESTEVLQLRADELTRRD